MSWFTDEALKGKKQRQQVMHKVLTFADSLSEIEQLPLILAGSFHLSEDNANLVLQKSNLGGFHCSGYLANSTRREIRASSLFFCSAPPIIQVSSVRPRLLRGMVKVGRGLREAWKNPEDAFYHDPVFALMKLSVPIFVESSERQFLDLDARLSSVSNCGLGMNSTVLGVRNSRANIAVAFTDWRSRSGVSAKSVTVNPNLTNVFTVRTNQNSKTSSKVLVVPELSQQQTPMDGIHTITSPMTSPIVQTTMSRTVNTFSLSSTSFLGPTSASHIPIFKRPVRPGNSNKHTTVAGYCIRRSQREPKQLDILRACLNRCDVIRGHFLNDTRQHTISISDNNVDEGNEDTMSEMIVNYNGRRLSTISETGESSCSEDASESDSDSLVGVNHYATHSETVTFNNAQLEQNGNQFQFELRPDFAESRQSLVSGRDILVLGLESTRSSSLSEVSTEDQIESNSAIHHRPTKSINTSQPTSLKSEVPIPSYDPATASSESRCRHFTMQSSVRLDLDSEDEQYDRSFIEHCQTCANNWRSTFASTIHDLAVEDERFVEGATDSDDPDSYQQAETFLDSIGEEKGQTHKFQGVQSLDDSPQGGSVGKSDQIRLENSLTCMLQ